MMNNEFNVFLSFVLIGLIIGFLFDFFRILRRSFKTSNIITYFEDVLFWILTGVLILYNIWYFNNGEIRIYMFLGIIMGGLIYMLTLSNIIISLLSKILILIVKVLELPFKTLFSIFHKFFTVFLKIFNNFPKKLKIKKGKMVKDGE